MTQDQFNLIVREWEQEKQFCSFAHQICKGDNYNKLKKAGWEIVPFILETLKTNGWMGLQHLISDITKEDIYVGEVEYGFKKVNVQASAEAWVRWGVERGLIIMGKL